MSTQIYEGPFVILQYKGLFVEKQKNTTMALSLGVLKAANGKIGAHAISKDGLIPNERRELSPFITLDKV